jgi:hypothetical protein
VSLFYVIMDFVVYFVNCGVVNCELFVNCELDFGELQCGCDEL